MKWLGLVITSVVILGSVPEPPDYSEQKYWAALPTIKDKADIVPSNSGFINNQNTAKVDVFYIHPTTYYRSYSGNGDPDDEKLNEFTDNQPIAFQASVYNGVAKVYAPRYRQAALHNFFKRDDSKSKKAFDIAYSDIKRSFEYYLKYYNKGRPIIIAGHSQGSMHGERLIREYFDGTKLQSKLVAAYLIGHSIPKNAFDVIPVCTSPSQSNCVISYNTFGWDSEPRYQEFGNAICVNPVSWKTDGKQADKSQHKGGVPSSFDRVDESLLTCKCVNGTLWITKPKERGYIMMGGKSYHLMDYSLFYKDIRDNVAERTLHHLSKK
jgi:hypothetical protein